MPHIDTFAVDRLRAEDVNFTTPVSRPFVLVDDGKRNTKWNFGQ